MRPVLHEMSGESPLRIEKLVILAAMIITVPLTFILSPVYIAAAISFFGRAIWFKKLCFGCSVLTALFLLSVVVLIIPLLILAIKSPSAEPAISIVIYLVVLVASATYGLLTVWIASVLYRDIRWRKRQGGN